MAAARKDETPVYPEMRGKVALVTGGAAAASASPRRAPSRGRARWS